MILDLPDDCGVAITLPVGVANQITWQSADRRWWANLSDFTPDPTRSPWDYMDDGPSGPELHTPDLAEAVAFVRDTASAHLARVAAERAAAEADLEKAAKEARNARRRTAQRG